MKKQLTEEQKQAKRDKRMALSKLSKELVMLKEMGQLPEIEDTTVNGLLRAHYKAAGHSNLKTFKEWKKEGYCVKKGEKSLLVWGNPLATKEEKERIENLKKKGIEAKEKEDFFPVCNLFSEKQVQKRN